MPDQEIEQYDRLPLRYAYQFLSDNDCSDVVNEIKLSQEEYKSYKSGLRRAKIVNLLDQKKLLNSFIEQYWHNGNTQKGKNHLNSLRRIFESYSNESDNEEDDAEEEVGESSFAYEEDLKNYLIANLSIIETGIKLYKDENGIDGIEYPIDPNNKRVDILAIDRDGIPVVVT